MVDKVEDPEAYKTVVQKKYGLASLNLADKYGLDVKNSTAFYATLAADPAKRTQYMQDAMTLSLQHRYYMSLSPTPSNEEIK